MLAQNMLFGLLLEWTLLGLAILPRGPGWPLWLVAIAQFTLMLVAMFAVFMRAEPLAVAPIFAILWFAIALLAALLSGSSAALVAQQFTIAAACAPLLLSSFQAEMLMPLAADPERNTALFLFGALLVAVSLVQATIGLYCVAMWVSPHHGGTAEHAAAPKAKRRAGRRNAPQPARAAQHMGAERHVQRFVHSVRPRNAEGGDDGGVPCGPLLVMLVIVLPLFSLLRLGAWIAFGIAGRTGAGGFSLAARLRITAVVLILQVSVFALLHGLIMFVS